MITHYYSLALVYHKAFIMSTYFHLFLRRLAFLLSLLDKMFPAQCIGCSTLNTLLCAQCLADIPEASPAPIPDCYSLFAYQHPVMKHALHSIKYSFRYSLLKVFESRWRVFVRQILTAHPDETFVIIPIPLSRKRKKMRGFNQAEILAHSIFSDQPYSSIYSIATDILIKTKNTPTQASLSNKKVRLTNLSGAFTIQNSEENKKRLINKTIILIDDVVTTGATLIEARKTLQKLGCRKIIAFTLAH